MRREFESLRVSLRAPEDETDEEGVVSIMACNWSSFIAFRACETQWRVVATMAGLIWIGLDYTACQIVLEQLDAPAYIFADLHAMEEAALPILNGVDG
nr:DUF1799 domain-containing protein [Sinorhizobium saheli]